MARRAPLSRPRRGAGLALAALGDGLLLLCALLGLTWSFLSLYDVAAYQRPMPVSFLSENLLLCYPHILTALAVILALAALLAWSLPRLRLAVCALLLAGWAGFVFWRREAVLQGGRLILRAIARLLYERCGWGAPVGSAPDLPLSAIADSVTLFLAAALLEGGQLQPAADVKGAAALGPVDLVGADGDQVRP